MEITEKVTFSVASRNDTLFLYILTYNINLIIILEIIII